MSDNDGKKTLGLRGTGSRPSNVKQSFSHGRTKNVVVETKRKRIVVPKPGAVKPAAAVLLRVATLQSVQQVSLMWKWSVV